MRASFNFPRFSDLYELSPDFDALTDPNCSNTSRKRRKAYNALVAATKSVLDVSIGP